MSDRTLLKRAARFEACEVYRRSRTRQGQFETGFVPVEGLGREPSDGGRAAGAIYRSLDRDIAAAERERRWNTALEALSDYPELKKTLVVIRRYRTREKIFSALKIKGETYRKRFERVTEILKSRFIIGGEVGGW